MLKRHGLAIGATLLAMWCIAAWAPHTADAQTAGRFSSTPIYSADGLASTVFSGGTVEELEAAAQAAAAGGVWVQDARGNFQLLVVGGPAFLKETFRARLPGTLAVTAVTLTAARRTVSIPESSPPTAASCTAMTVRANAASGDIFVATSPRTATTTVTIRKNDATAYQGELPAAASPAVPVTGVDLGRALPATVHGTALGRGTTISATCGTLSASLNVTDLAIAARPAPGGLVLVRGTSGSTLDAIWASSSGAQSLVGIGIIPASGNVGLLLAGTRSGDTVLIATPSDARLAAHATIAVSTVQ